MIAPSTHPAALPAFHVMAKPTGAICNLACDYCYFRSKEQLYPGSRFRMTDEVLAAYMRQLLAASPQPEVMVAWQGGEPTLMGLDFFKRAVELAEQYRQPHQRIRHTLQTNGTLLDAEWAAFFKAHHFLIGLSIDGPRDLHDAYRVTKGGAGSFDQARHGWEVLRQHAVEVNILCALHAANADRPREVYKFLRDELGARFIQFIPIVERAVTTTGGPHSTARSITPRQYGRFLVEVFDEWVRHDVGRVYVQLFDATLGAYVGQYSLCVHSPTCGAALALEHTGDLYACDHFVEPDYRLGNIKETDLAELIVTEQQQHFGQAKLSALPRDCRDCDVRWACHGGCPKDRWATTPVGEPGLNYLCAGYQHFFRHAQDAMRFMANELRFNRPPARVMDYMARQDEVWRNRAAMTPRNDPYPCGSGRKTKQCHGSR